MLLSKNSYNLTDMEMILKSINLIVEDKFPLFCKYIIVSLFHQVKNYLLNKKSRYANLKNNCLEDLTTSRQSNSE